MSSHRFDGRHQEPLFEVPWELDREYRMNPSVMTSLLREQVPVLDFVNWEVRIIEPAFAETVLPLNPEATNQHFTHQASLLVLAADYTGGLAVSSLIHGWPIAGVHPVRSSKSIALWLIKVEIKYLRPSVGDLIVSARVEPEKRARIQRRFLEGKPVLESVVVHFRNGSVDVAEATLTYYARQSERLRSDGAANGKMNTLYQLKLTSSAEMIAGVRARESGKLFNDPYAAQMAGQHGIATATRFCERMPQLGGMVAARTAHLDGEIMEFVSQGGRDLVIVGVGWDMRPFRLRLPAGTRVYELDYPSTLAERRRRIAELQMAPPPGVERLEIGIDLRTTPLCAALAGSDETGTGSRTDNENGRNLDLANVPEPALAEPLRESIDPRRPIFIAWEGMSMYFEEPEIRRILDGMSPLMEHPESRLWVDLVDRKAVDSPELCPREVQAFMHGMQLLGEPFTFGTDCVDEFMAQSGFDCREVTVSDLFFEGSKDPVFSLYRFCVASRSVASRGEGASVPILAIHPGADPIVPASPHPATASQFPALPPLQQEQKV
jgi:O-methyltransferase involved in polyketide biosynthesis/acyl-coenzyme A thioesterase PaaI-like protein